MLIDIFQFKFLKNLSYREIGARLDIDRRTVSRYVQVMERNIEEIRSSDEMSIDEMINLNWEAYIDRIITFKATRKKKVLTPIARKAIYRLSEVLDTTSPQKIYDFIYENYDEFKDTVVAGLTYPTIRRALLEKKDIDKF